MLSKSQTNAAQTFCAQATLISTFLYSLHVIAPSLLNLAQLLWVSAIAHTTNSCPEQHTHFRSFGLVAVGAAVKNTSVTATARSYIFVSSPYS